MQSVCRREFASLFSEGVTAEPDPGPWAARRRRDILFSDSYLLWLHRHCDSIRTTVHLIISLGPLKFLKILSQPRANIAGTDAALGDRSGFCGIGSTLAPMPLIGAYARGRYPRSFFGTLSWWSPLTRTGVIPDQVKISNEIAALLACGALRVTLDSDFDGVVAACSHSFRSDPLALAMGERGAAAPTPAPAHMHLLAILHDLGIAHSFEVWDARHGLIAGGYGISVGAVLSARPYFHPQKMRHLPV